MLNTIEQQLQRTTPEQQGVDSSAILEFVQALERDIHEVHSFMLLRHGSVIAEGWWSPYQRDYPHMLFSLSKSFTSTAVGMAVAEGHFSINDPVISFFPDDLPASVSDHLAAMQVRHLLTMSTGHAIDSMPPMIQRADLDWIKGFFAVAVEHQPGTHFLYNTGATYMLSAIVQKTTGMKLIDYLQPRLFDPLGIENPTWEESPQGISTGGFGLNITTEAVARFGQLYLQKGVWQGKRILSEAWIDAATSSQISNGNHTENDWTHGYGYQFWRCRHNAYRGDGAFGQYCIVMPDQDAVLAILSGLPDMQLPLNLVWKHLLPAMEDQPRTPDATAQQRLSEKLATLNIAPLQEQAAQALAAQVSDRTFRFDDNPLKLESIRLKFSDSGCTLTIKTPRREETIPAAYGAWQQGETALFNEPWMPDPVPVVSSIAWTAADRFTMVVRRYLTPFFHTIEGHLVGDQLTLTHQVNVAFVPQPPDVLTARVGK